ncbi:Sorting nexin-17-like 1 [Homarus americanus]|uniref:Sorting nexin-17-like 1 n=1 Tax=Homarus americanus TaxID=6706 RepID=A0A8J5TW30_HOMAM|nr:Sorting nexin-17-like 1 [Homarus americanus]
MVVKRLQDFESPYISQRCVKGMHRIVLRKNFWDPSIDLDVMGDRVGLNLLYAQTVQDVERGWILTNREIQRQLAALQAKGAKRENSDSDQSLPANQEEEEEMVDDLTPSTSPPHNLLHAWKPLLGKSEISGAEQIVASGERQSVAATLMDTVEPARSVPAPGFSDVQVEDLQEIIGQHQQQQTIQEILEEEDEEQEEQQPTQEDDVNPGEPTTRQLTELLTNISRLSEQLKEYDTRPLPQNLFFPVLDKGMEEYKALYMSRVNARQQALITRYLCKAQPDDDTTNDDIEVLGDLLVEELPQDFEGFDAEKINSLISVFGTSKNTKVLWISTIPAVHL